MKYQEIYTKYQETLKVHELSIDTNYSYLTSAFHKKSSNNVNLTVQDRIIMYLAGIKEIFVTTENKTKKVSEYKDKLEMLLTEQKN